YAYQAGNETEKGIKVYYNGEKINFSGTKPVIKNGYTLVPVRGVFEKMGAEVKWDNKSQTVTITEGDNTIKLTLNSKKASVNGSTVNLDVPVQSINNRTLIPLRFITEAIGGSIFWGGTEADGYIAICK
ncbi:MAG TPA: copper amine oxidase N-terminal domain-containing protein, partial [Clostridia bacterium]|nr:copper amine oxidase N-terminal domain-containing protein [Clostridia bacterium]